MIILLLIIFQLLALKPKAYLRFVELGDFRFVWVSAYLSRVTFRGGKRLAFLKAGVFLIRIPVLAFFVGWLLLLWLVRLGNVVFLLRAPASHIYFILLKISTLKPFS
jgi:hypothetical protein